jgi:hypothetical protein
MSQLICRGNGLCLDTVLPNGQYMYNGGCCTPMWCPAHVYCGNVCLPQWILDRNGGLCPDCSAILHNHYITKAKPLSTFMGNYEILEHNVVVINDSKTEYDLKK